MAIILSTLHAPLIISDTAVFTYHVLFLINHIVFVPVFSLELGLCIDGPFPVRPVPSKVNSRPSEFEAPFGHLFPFTSTFKPNKSIAFSLPRIVAAALAACIRLGEQTASRQTHSDYVHISCNLTNNLLFIADYVRFLHGNHPAHGSAESTVLWRRNE
jgi:hypothetical protein